MSISDLFNNKRVSQETFGEITGSIESPDLVKEINKKNKTFFPNVNFNYIEERKGHVFLTKADISPILKLGWKPQMNINEGIDECFRLLKKELGE